MSALSSNFIKVIVMVPAPNCSIRTKGGNMSSHGAVIKSSGCDRIASCETNAGVEEEKLCSAMVYVGDGVAEAMRCNVMQTPSLQAPS